MQDCVLVTCFVEIPSSGSWTFSLDATGDAIVRLHDARLLEIEAARKEGPRVESIQLQKGRHPLRVYWRPGTGEPVFNLCMAPGPRRQKGKRKEPLRPIPAQALSHDGRADGNPPRSPRIPQEFAPQA